MSIMSLVCGLGPVRTVSSATLSALACTAVALAGGPTTAPVPAPAAAGFFLQRDLPTGISSDAEVFISLRYMRHLWMTDDGAQATVVQQGGLGGHGLAIYKSLDEGLSWTLEADLLSKVDAVSDGTLLPDGSLLLVTSISSTGPVGHINFIRLNYDPGLREWSVDPTTPTQVFVSNQSLRASRASIAVDTNGVLWCSFRLQDTSAGTFQIRLFCSTDGGLTWLDSQNALGTANGLEEKGAKVLAAGSGISVIYQDMLGSAATPTRLKAWAHRDDSQPLQDPLTTQVIAQMSAEGGDPLGSHWSVAADLSGNLVLTYQDDRIKFLRYDATSQAWSSPVPLSFFKGSYNSVSVGANGDVYVFADLDVFDKVVVKRFSTAAQKWTGWIPVSLSDQPGLLRMCSPERFQNQLAMLYQVNETNPYDLLYCLLDL